MKSILLALLFAPIAQAKILSGSAVCASEGTADYAFQFTWDDQARLTSVTLFRQQRGSSERVHEFRLKQDAKAFAIAPDHAKLEVTSATGETIRLDAPIDDHGIGGGTLDWVIPKEHFQESGGRAMCSF